MLDLDDLSAIGFGTYRWTATPEQARALQLALDAGCNLVDTAATYGAGLAERGLGRELARRGSTAFVITKAGYLHDGESAPGAVVLSDGRSGYSIHPDLLARRIAQSAHNLGRDVLDGFLLHNPEHLLATEATGTYLRHVSLAFEFCERAVDEGLIRFYGISSNTLADPDHPLGPSALDTLVAIAGAITGRHHFRLVQFPHNLAERHAVHGRSDLFAVAARNGLRTLGNRPLSARTDAGPVRLLDPPSPPPRPAAAALGDLARTVDDALADAGLRTAGTPPALAAILERWPDVRTVDAVEFVVEQVLAPLVARLAHTSRASRLATLLAEVRSAALTETRRAQALAGAEVVGQAHLAGDTGDPTARRVCASYLRDGLDHVLLGMRNPDHVRTIAPLLSGDRPAGFAGEVVVTGRPTQGADPVS
jgi:aryl-alcohol dehydrogenase-like predicted oxidoreductase